jgi:hypothetical protein
MAIAEANTVATVATLSASLAAPMEARARIHRWMADRCCDLDPEIGAATG